MKKLIYYTSLILILSFTYSCRRHESLLIIGTDDQGREVESRVDSEKFVKQAMQTFSDVHNTTLNMLESNDNPRWNLEKIEVGVGVNFTVGNDKVFKWSYNPGYKMIYQKIKI